jgi:hypothetical protein
VLIVVIVVIIVNRFLHLHTIFVVSGLNLRYTWNVYRSMVVRLHTASNREPRKDMLGAKSADDSGCRDTPEEFMSCCSLGYQVETNKVRVHD